MALSVKTREHIRRWAALAGPKWGALLGGAAALAAAIAFTGSALHFTTVADTHGDTVRILTAATDLAAVLQQSGTLPLGEKLPSVRELSTQLTINPNTIQRAYRELETEGYICSVAGRGSYVCAQIPDDPARQDALLQQFDAAVQELLYLGMRSEELRRRIPEGGTNT